jgi:putative ABC transport system permease protein
MFSSGMTGTAMPRIAPGTYAGVIGLAAVLAVAAVTIPGRFAMRARPEASIGLRE